MKDIQLIYAQNSTSVKAGYTVQEVAFAILVKSSFQDKHINVHWAGDDNMWHILPAYYHFYKGRGSQGREQWSAKMSFHSSQSGNMPGSIRFALQYLGSGKESWDNNYNSNYLLHPGDSVVTGPGVLLVHIDYRPYLSPDQALLPVIVAANRSLLGDRFFLHWTTDSWKSCQQTMCVPSRSCSNSLDKKHGDTPVPTDDTGDVLHTCQLKVQDASRIEYAIGCQSEQGEVWDNNFGTNYVACRPRLKVLTLNLHCYQESDQEKKFNEIAEVIAEIDIDVVCLQEVGEEIIHGEGNRQTNAARIIREGLLQRGRYYHLHTDWSHIGFKRYREGSAILSKYRFLAKDARYVSTSTDIHSIHSRKVVMGRIHLPFFGPVNVFSVHLSWWKNGFWQQFEKLCQWVDDIEAKQGGTTLLCGDFNTGAGSHGYMLMAENTDFEDQFLRSTSSGLFTKIFRTTLPNRQQLLDEDERIDYILSRKNSKLIPISSRVLFSGKDYRTVSDHPGYLTEFKPE